MSRKVRYALGAVGGAMLVGLYFVRGRDSDTPGWALGLVLLVVVALSVAQDLALWRRP